MLSLEDIIEEAIQRDASDIHIICGLKPVLRIKKSLIPSKYLRINRRRYLWFL